MTPLPIPGISINRTRQVIHAASEDPLALAYHPLDANAHFSRPGPRLIEGIEILSSVLHPASVPQRPKANLQSLVSNL